MKRVLILFLFLVCLGCIHEVKHWQINKYFDVKSHFEINVTGFQTVPENQTKPELLPFLLLAHSINEIVGYLGICGIIIFATIKMFQNH